MSADPRAGRVAAPLDGITVVSVEQAVAAPFATRQLADLGARVIKIERPDGGDFARGYDRSVHGQSSYFVWLNRGKESLALNLTAPCATDILAGVLARADVFVQNLAPGAAGRLGLDAGRLRARDPRLIVCDVSGYGTEGPLAGRRAYDLLVQCEAGVLAVTGTPDEPAKVGISVADIAGGMYAYSTILAALFARERKGTGAQIEVSLFDALSEWMSQPMYYAMYTGIAPQRTGTSHATIAPYGTFRVADGAVQLAVQNEREWVRLCTSVLGLPLLAEDNRFTSNAARVEHRDELTAVIEAALVAYDVTEVRQRLDDARIANGTYNTVADVLNHPQLVDRWASVGTPKGEIRALKPPGRIAGHDAALGDVPAVGEHTDALLTELGYDAATIDEWRARGAIA